jgi:hypothetical protein
MKIASMLCGGGGKHHSLPQTKADTAPEARRERGNETLDEIGRNYNVSG